MAHGGTDKYYNPANKVVNDGDTAFADDVNNVNYAVDTALARVADDLDVMGVRVTTLSAEAESWAHNDQGIPPNPLEPTEFSSKAYATESKEYAIQAEGVVVHKADGTTQLIDSAHVSATKAAASQVAALASKNAAALSETNAEAHSLQAWADQQVGFESMQDAQAAASAAEDSADLAALSAANLPNATTAGADKIIVTNSSGDGWDYVSRVGFGRKNLLINGGFDVWQRGMSFADSLNMYTADRWLKVVTSSTFLVDYAYIHGQEEGLTRCIKLQPFACQDAILLQRVEGLQRFSNKTVTLSFWAKSDDPEHMSVEFVANFGTGGTPSTIIQAIGVTKVATTASWVKYSVTAELPSMLSSIFGTNNDSHLDVNFWYSASSVSNLRTDTLGQQIGVFYLSNVQLEFGDTATDFECRHPAEEFALCQRYYETGTLRGPFSQYLTTYAVGPYCPFLIEKRRVPEVTTGTLTAVGNDGTPGILFGTNEFTRGFNPVYNWTGGTAGRSFFGQLDWIADAEIY